MKPPIPPIRKTIGTGLLCVLGLLAWLNLAPSQLGGRTSYVITQGNSMAPRFDEGDLVLLHEARYEAGDVIGYRSSDLQEVVMHRVVEETPEGFITKGDNNSWLDSDRPKYADVLGKEWLHLPGAGRWLARIRSPGVAAVLTGLVSLSFFLGNGQKKRRQPNGKGPQVPRIGLENIDRQSRNVMGALVVAIVFFLVLAFASFRQPAVSAVSADAAYEHVGTFGYSAKVPPSPVYPAGKVEPGRPIFLNLVDQLRVTFDYHLNSEADKAVSGEALMFARVGGATGWTKVVPLAKATSFKGDTVRLEGTVDFDQIRELSHSVQKITGLTESEQTIEIVPRIDVRGDLAGERIAGRFVPTLMFAMDSYQARVAAGSAEETAGAVQGGVGPFRHTEPGEVKVNDIRSNAFNLLGLSVPVGKARGFSLFGAMLGLLVLSVLWRRISGAADKEEVALIANKHRDWLIPVEAMPTTDRRLVQIKSMDALVRMAEVYERMILHEEALGKHSYFVEEDGVIYYYRPQALEKPPVQSITVPVTAVAPAADSAEKHPGEPETVENVKAAASKKTAMSDIAPALTAAMSQRAAVPRRDPSAESSGISETPSAPEAEPPAAPTRKVPAVAKRPFAAGAAVAKKRRATPKKKVPADKKASTPRVTDEVRKRPATTKKRRASDSTPALEAAAPTDDGSERTASASITSSADAPKKLAQVPARESREERRKRECSRLKQELHKTEAEVL